MATIIFLVCFGLVILYSTSAYSAQEKFGDPMWYFRKQTIITIGSLIVMTVVSWINYHVYARFAKLSYVVAFILMLLILRRHLELKDKWGKKMGRNSRYAAADSACRGSQDCDYPLYPFLVCRTGKYIEKWDHLKRNSVLWRSSRNWCTCSDRQLEQCDHCTWNYCGHFICILSEDKENRAVLYAGSRLFGYIGVRIWASSLAKSDNFRLQRIIVWIDPEKYADNKGFQTLQALYAVGSGGFWGKGLGASTQKLIIPEVQNDMILLNHL